MAPTATSKKPGRKPGSKVPVATPAQRERQIEQALDSLGADGRYHPVSEAVWNKLREEVWRAWLELEDVQGWPADERKPGELRPWPPDGAFHDRISGHALRWILDGKDGGGRGPYDAKPIIRRLAEEALQEVEDFRKLRPAKARSIAKPLQKYEAILRELRDKPELGLTSEG